MIRAVVDANVLVSGAIVTYGASAFLVDAIKRRQFLFITADETFTSYTVYWVIGECAASTGCATVIANGW